jgi:hypothetical protein
VTEPLPLQDNPLYRLGAGLSAVVDSALAQGLLLLDRAAADPTALITTVAVIGIACASGLWLLGTLFGRARPPARPPDPRPPAPTVVVQTARPRRPPVRPRRRARRKAQNPILRLFGVR